MTTEVSFAKFSLCKKKKARAPLVTAAATQTKHSHSGDVHPNMTRIPTRLGVEPRCVLDAQVHTSSDGWLRKKPGLSGTQGTVLTRTMFPQTWEVNKNWTLVH